MQQAASMAVARALKAAPRGFGRTVDRRLATQARRMEACALSTVIKLVTPKDEATQIILSKKRSCRIALCYPCARYRAYQANLKIGSWLDDLAADQPTIRYAFLTLTSRNKPLSSAAEMFTLHEQALARFWRGRRLSTSVLGHITGIEIALRTNNEGEPQAGVHSHSLLALHPDYFDRTQNLYLAQRAYVALWRRALRADYDPICHVTAIANTADARGSLRECIKYAVAPHKLFQQGPEGPIADPITMAHLSRALYRRRLLRYGGVFSAAQRRVRRKRTTPSGQPAGASPKSERKPS